MTMPKVPKPKRPAATLWAITAVLTAVTVFLLVVFFVSYTAKQNNDNRSAAKQGAQNQALIEQLQEQLSENDQEVVEDAAVVEDRRRAEAETVECITRFTYAIQDALANVILTQGDLVVAITQTIPGPEREAAVADVVARLAEVNEIYRFTFAQRVAHDIAGNPLPCPLPPGLNG